MRVVHGYKADEGENIFAGYVRPSRPDLLGRSRFRPNPVPLDGGIGPAAVLHHALHNGGHPPGSIRGDHLAHRLLPALVDHFPLIVADLLDQVGLLQVAPVGHGRYGHQLLQGSNGDPLPEGGGGQFQGAHLVQGKYQTGTLPGIIDPRFFAEAEGVDISKQLLLPQALPQFDKGGVAGTLHRLEIGDAAMAPPRRPAADIAAGYGGMAGTVKILIFVKKTFLDGRRQSDQLKGGAGFKRAGHRQQRPVVRVVFPVMEGIEIRPGGGRQDLPRAGVGGHGHGPFRPVLQHGPVQLPLHDILDGLVDGQVEVHPFLGRHKAPDFVGDLAPIDIGREKKPPFSPLQLLFVEELQPSPALVGPYKTQQLGSQPASRIIALPLGGKGDPLQVQLAHLLGHLGVYLPLKVDGAAIHGQQLVKVVFIHLENRGQQPGGLPGLFNLGRYGHHRLHGAAAGQKLSVTVVDGSPGGTDGDAAVPLLPGLGVQFIGPDNLDPGQPAQEGTGNNKEADE